jgi:hypothetical protein
MLREASFGESSVSVLGTGCDSGCAAPERALLADAWQTPGADLVAPTKAYLQSVATCADIERLRELRRGVGFVHVVASGLAFKFKWPQAAVVAAITGVADAVLAVQLLALAGSLSEDDPTRAGTITEGESTLISSLLGSLLGIRGNIVFNHGKDFLLALTEFLEQFESLVTVDPGDGVLALSGEWSGNFTLGYAVPPPCPPRIDDSGKFNVDFLHDGTEIDGNGTLHSLTYLLIDESDGSCTVGGKTDASIAIYGGVTESMLEGAITIFDPLSGGTADVPFRANLVTEDVLEGTWESSSVQGGFVLSRLCTD